MMCFRGWGIDISSNIPMQHCNDNCCSNWLMQNIFATTCKVLGSRAIWNINIVSLVGLEAYNQNTSSNLFKLSMSHASLGKSRHFKFAVLHQHIKQPYSLPTMLMNHCLLELQAFQDLVKFQSLEQLFSKMLPSP
jgi:hypothetical protein